MKFKTLIFPVLFFCFCFGINSQSLTPVQQDSLMTVWNDASQPETTRLKAIHTIAREGFLYKNPDSAFYYGQLQYDFAKSTKNKEYIFQALNIQGDSYLLKGDPDKAYSFFKKALKISEEIGDKKFTINILGSISRVFEAKGEIEKSFEYSLEMLKLSEEIQDKEGVGTSLLNIGRTYMRKGDLPLSLEQFVRSRKIFEELEDLEGLAKARKLIAITYIQQGFKEEGLKQMLQNAAYYEETENKVLLAGTMANIGTIYSDLGDNKKALENLEKALQFFESSANVPYIAGLSGNIGRIYHLEGNLERSLEYYTKALNLSEIIKDKYTTATMKYAIGNILSEQEKYPKAISYSSEALTAFQETEDIIGISNAAYSLINSYKATGSYKKALEMNELYYQMRDSFNSKENQKTLIELQVQSNYDKQKAIDDVEKEKEITIATQKTNAQRNISIAIGVALLLISFLAYVIFKRLKVTREQKAIIEEQKKKVEQSEKYKEQFLANMSHEIRTPMHAISGMLKILERNEHPAAQDIYLKAMQTSSDNLVVILNDVLDLSKIEAGKLDLESIPLSPLLVVESVVQLLKFKAEEKGLKLTVEVGSQIPDLVMGDPTRLNQILINLAGNAIKFTNKGAVTIILKVENQQLVFVVKDTGIGISKNQQKSIFSAFTQAKESTTRYYGGTGLGLSISKQLVELQQGRIWLESEPGSGSNFNVCLPLTIPEANATSQDLISEEELKAMAASLKGIRILIAEDNPFNQMIAQDDLSYYIDAVTITTVENGALAVEKFTTDTFDLILMDVQMPEMNGFEATKKIRALENKNSIDRETPIIAMTASLLKTEIDQCFKAGMNNYIPKPYTLKELIGPIFKELRS
jgi:signal transduction histidine kinase/CheY-like chemotaxis protein